MIVGIGMCMLVIGLIGIVILQMVRSQMLEGFVYTGAVTPNCKLDKTKITEEDYKDWCNRNSDQCAWDEDIKDCDMNSKYKPKDPTIPDDVMDPCDGPCSQLSGDYHACTRCEKCVVCVNDDNDTSGSSSTCIDVSKYTAKKCPGTMDDDFGKGSDSSPGTGGRLPQMDENDVEDTPSKKTSKTNKTNKSNKSKKQEADYEDSGSFSDDTTKITKDILSNGMNFDYVMNESNVTANAKQKNNQAKFLKDIQSIVRNEMLNQQGMTTANSQEYLRDKAQRRRENMKPNRKPGCPDMSDYVRKDSIPCWGCTLE